MSILNFIKSNFHLTAEKIKTLEPLTKIASDNFLYKNEYTIKKTCQNYKREISIQKEISENAQKLMPGAEALLSSLSQIPPHEILSMRFIDSTHWDGRVYFDEHNSLIGLTLGKKKNTDWSTPPNWDGTEDMLKKHNESKNT